jgi:hypothetical protein
MFQNFEDRGEVFRNVVTQINASQSSKGTSDQADDVVPDNSENANTDT